MVDRRDAPLVHSVHFYDYDGELIERLRGIVISALATGNSVLMVATEEHRKQLATALTEQWVNWTSAEDEGRFLMMDARETLATFMVNGLPSQTRFNASVRELVNNCKHAARTANRGLTVFGEMVALLWQDGNKTGALKLEGLWNDMLSDRAFHLHCAYPKHSFGSDEDEIAMQSICEAHSHIVSRPPVQ